MFLKTLSFAVAMGMIAGQASALRCITPTVAETFERTQASPFSYVIVLGSFDISETVAAGDIASTHGKPYDLNVQFSGQAFGAHGFAPIGNLSVRVFVQCISVWCGYPPNSDGLALAFLRMDDAGYALDTGPCGGDVFAQVSAQDIATIERLAKEAHE